MSGGQTRGPFTSKQLRDLAESGDLSPDDRIREESDTKWRPAGKYRGLFDVDESKPRGTKPESKRSDQPRSAPLPRRRAAASKKQTGNHAKLIWIGGGVVAVLALLLGFTLLKQPNHANPPVASSAPANETAAAPTGVQVASVSPPANTPNDAAVKRVVNANEPSAAVPQSSEVATAATPAASSQPGNPQSADSGAQRKDVPRDPKLSFRDDGQNNFVFDTGIISGRIQKDGQAHTLKSITFLDGNVAVDAHNGLLVPYRFLTPQKRFGFGSWEWDRTGKLSAEGSAVLDWGSAPDRPFAFRVTYSIPAADTLDMSVVFTPQTDLEKFELFFGSYFPKPARAWAYVRDAGNGQPGFFESTPDANALQLYPRDDAAVQIANDGRWKFGPYPNELLVRPILSAPLGMRRDTESGVTVIYMSRPDDCFAVSTISPGKAGPFYLSLFGKDVKKGQSLSGRARIVIGKNLTERQVLDAYEKYLAE